MIDALIELEELEPKIANAKQSLAFGEAAEKARTPLQQAPRHALMLARLLSVAQDLDALGDAGVRQRLDQAIEKAESVGEALETAQGAAALDAATYDYPQVSSSLARVLDGLRARWREIAKRDFEDLIPVGELLTKIAGAETIGANLVDIGRQALALAETDPNADQLAARVSDLRTRRTQALEAMRAFTGEPEVDEFLSAVTHQQATLALVTPKVLDWLRTKGALDAFRVRS